MPPNIALKSWREKSRLTLREAAILLDMSSSEVCDYERGTRTPGLKRAVKFDDVCGIPVRAWLGGDR